jgi:hypothetical protein
MKIYEEIVFDMSTMEVVSEVSYEYDGPVAECKGGGGGSSGKVDFPNHMKTAHKDWLDDTGTDTMTFSVVALMNTAMSGASPYNGYVPKDPDAAFFAAGNSLSNYTSVYEYLNDLSSDDLNAIFSSYVTDDDTKITAAIAAHSALLDDEITTNVLPKFKAGMVNTNATMGSAFVIGEALILDSKAKKIADTDAKIRLQRLQEGGDLALRRLGAWVEWRKNVTAISTEASRIYLAAYGDRDDDYLEGLHKDATWDLEMYQYGTQVMASISGQPSQSMPRKSKTASAIGGAMSGAAMGGMIAGASSGAIAGPVGIGVGAALGLAATL